VLLFRDPFVISEKTKKCWCPQIDNWHGSTAFCGHEIIELRASANAATRNCNPRNVYKCAYGPNYGTFEIKCEENQTCIPGSPAYQKLRTSKGHTLLDYSRNHSRFCASNEGKTL